jgi:cytochrome c-type biogenesis protein CcmH/NrfG
MPTDPPLSGTRTRLKTEQVYVMAVICLGIGVLLGYLFRGSESQRGPNVQAMVQPIADRTAAAGMPKQMPTLDDMKRMADKKAEPLLLKLKGDPRNASLLNQIGTLYKAAHQFKEAGEYYDKSLQIDPKNVGARTDLAACLYYEGDADGAIKQLQESLQYDSKNANALFNLGMIEWQAKKDSSGAVKAWRRLLASNPGLPEKKKAAVERLIGEASPHISVNQ